MNPADRDRHPARTTKSQERSTKHKYIVVSTKGKRQCSGTHTSRVLESVVLGLYLYLLYCDNLKIVVALGITTDTITGSSSSSSPSETEITCVAVAVAVAAPSYSFFSWLVVRRGLESERERDKADHELRESIA